ncbi:peroxiredoxin [Maribacter halichondriae]|uniref:peroxiredoxin n=1 Tax=Maribacter halichondriae TaxID=2980554 RepID=UPI0023583578|nr:peroxiredoxin [Maribacter sp. Hal144]
MGLKIGDPLPKFELKNQTGNTLRSSDFHGKKPVVIYFYPKDYTPGCTKQACNFRDSYEDFTNLGAEVVGISSDSAKMHRKFTSTYDLPFVLLSDPNKKTRKLFGVENRIFNLLPGRETFVFDKQGKLIMVFNNMNTSQHVKKALQALKQ